VFLRLLAFLYHGSVTEVAATKDVFNWTTTVAGADSLDLSTPVPPFRTTIKPDRHSTMRRASITTLKTKHKKAEKQKTTTHKLNRKAI
jgi:hypothetical protein